MKQRSLVLAGFVLAFAAGCGGSAANTPALTSARVPGPDAVLESDDDVIARLLRERDAVALRLAELERAADVQHERSDKAMSRLAARDDFEDGVWTQLERVDAKLRSLRARVASARRPWVDAFARTIADRRGAIEKTMHRVHAVPAVEWDAFKREIEIDLAGMSRDVEIAGEADRAHATK